MKPGRKTNWCDATCAVIQAQNNSIKWVVFIWTWWERLHWNLCPLHYVHIGQKKPCIKKISLLMKVYGMGSPLLPSGLTCCIQRCYPNVDLHSTCSTQTSFRRKCWAKSYYTLNSWRRFGLECDSDAWWSRGSSWPQLSAVRSVQWFFQVQLGFRHARQTASTILVDLHQQ